MTKRSITLASTEVDFTVARSRRRKTIGLRVGDDGLVVTLPNGVGLHHAERAVLEKQSWVLDRLERAKARARPALEGVDGEIISWLGAPMRLTLQGHDRARTRVERRADALLVSLDQTLSPDMAASTVCRALKRWRKDEALALMTPKLEAYAKQLGAPQPKVRVREQAARWGSCSEDGVIRMNARLIHYEEALVDYVCAHEACHLLVMDHSKRFHALMDQIMPDNKTRRAALREAVPVGARF